MGKFKFNSILILSIFLLHTVSSEIKINAAAEDITYVAPGIAFIESGQNVTFSVTNTEGTKSILWDFGRDVSGPNTRYSNLTSVSHMIYAEGRYDIIFTAFYEDKNYSINEYTLFVDYEEKDSVDVINNEALFFAVAGTEPVSYTHLRAHET